MEKVYLDPKNPGSLGGVDRFRKAAKVSRKEAEIFLQGLDEYTVNKDNRKRFKRNRIIVDNLQQQFQMDLADMSLYKAENDGITFLLVVIDCFSKLASVQPIKSKTGAEVLAGLKKVFRELGEPQKLQCDKGKEFYNRTVRDYCKEHDITLFSSENADIKCSMAENLIRTLKSRIWRLFRHRVSTRYVDKLQDFVHAYNHSEHSSIQMRPIDVKQTNSLKVFNQLYKELLDHQPHRRPLYKVGEAVRIAKDKGKFEKGYEQRFQEEIFIIDKVVEHPVPMYRLKDETNEPVIGKFYEPELSLIRGVKNKAFRIDRVLKKRGRKLLVRWLGLGPERDEWIDRSQLQ